MRLSLSRQGLYVLFRVGSVDRTRQPLGFVIKPASRMMFSEREGFFRGFRIGPLFLRTYHHIGGTKNG